MAWTRSAARRKPICSFRVSPMARRPRRLNCSAASTMPGSTSRIGLKCFKSSAVSDLTSPSSFVSGSFGIGSFLSFVRFSQADDPADPSAKQVADHVKPPAHGSDGNQSLLAVLEPAVYRDDRFLPFELGRHLEGNPRSLAFFAFFAGSNSNP